MTNKNPVNVTAGSDKVSSATPGDRRDPIAVEGTPGKIAKFATATTITDSIITESEGHIGVGTPASSAILTVTSAAAGNAAIRASNTATNGIGVYSESPSGCGVSGVSQSDVGVYGRSNSHAGVLAESPYNRALIGFSTNHTGVYGSSDRDVGVLGQSATSHGVLGSSTHGTGVYGSSIENAGVFGISSDSAGVWGTNSNGYGVFGESSSGTAVAGRTTRGTAVAGQSSSGTGVFGESSSGTAVFGQTTGSGYAGYFGGPVHVAGRFSKAGGGFMIDHPLDPTTKTLAHSFVESPDMMNVYNGNVTTDANGEASVTLPAYFEALNQDFRYQLTVIGQFAQAIVAEEIRNNQFTIKTDQPRVKVSWQVTGIRQDPWAVANRIAAEDEKAAEDKGRYLHLELWGQPEEAMVHPIPPRIDRLEEPLRIDRARLEEERRQVEELVQRIHQRVPWKEGEGPTSPESP